MLYIIFPYGLEPVLNQQILIGFEVILENSFTVVYLKNWALSFEVLSNLLIKIKPSKLFYLKNWALSFEVVSNLLIKIKPSKLLFQRLD